MNRKGIVLAGGRGTRLYPITKSVSKQLLPVFDKPLIFYPLSTLILAGISEILVIVNPSDLPLFRDLLGDGSQWGIKILFKTQVNPNGIAEALILAEDYLGESPCALILGDNVFHGQGLGRNLTLVPESGATILAYQVTEPQSFGVVEFDEIGNVASISEKPRKPKSDWAIPGLYFYDASAPTRAKNLKASPRGELEITDLNHTYLNEGTLSVIKLSRGLTWFDTGTADRLLDASDYVRLMQRTQGLLVGSPEEAAWRMGLLDDMQLAEIAKSYSSDYGRLLRLSLRR
jgi:glucose-1-phosphate thymidylyltransferase